MLYYYYSGTDQGVVDLWLVRKQASSQEDDGPYKLDITLSMSLLAHHLPVTCLAFSDTASLLASGCQAGLVQIWDLAVRQIVFVTLFPHNVK